MWWLSGKESICWTQLSIQVKKKKITLCPQMITNEMVQFLERTKLNTCA